MFAFFAATYSTRQAVAIRRLCDSDNRVHSFYHLLCEIRDYPQLTIQGTTRQDVERDIRSLDAGNLASVRQYVNQYVAHRQLQPVATIPTFADIHAAIGRVQLTKVGAWTKQRQDNAAFLSANLEAVTPPPVAEGAVHVYHQYTIRVPQDRDGLAKALREEYNIGSGMFYPIPNHQLAPFRVDVDLPETAKAAAECLSLPVHPSLSQDDLERIVAAVNALAKAGA